MASTITRWWRPEPGAAGPFRRARVWAGAALWGTDRRRTITVVAGVCLLVAAALLRGGVSAMRLFQVAVLLATLLAILLKPHIGVLALVAYRILSGAFNMEEIVGRLGLTGIKSLGLLTLVGFVGIVILKRVRPSFGNRDQVVFLLGLFFANLLSSFVALSFATAWIHLFQMLQNLLLYFIFVNLYSSEKWLNRYVWVTAGVILLSAVSGLLALRGGETRIAGTVGNPNGLAMVANQGAVIFLVAALFERFATRRFLWMTALGGCILAILFTGSRGGILTLVVTFAFQLMKRRRSLTPYLVGIIVLAAAFAFVPEAYKERQTIWFNQVLTGNMEEASGGSRGFIYRSALELWKRSPLIGVGPRSFGALYQQEFAYMAKGAAKRVLVVHSGLLEILVENGVFGFLVFAGIVATTFALFAANERIGRAAGFERWRMLNGIFEGVFLAAIVSGAFETIVKTNNFWLAAAGAAVVNEALKRRLTRERAEFNGAARFDAAPALPARRA